MLEISKERSFLPLLLGVVCFVRSSYANTVTLEAVESGWYYYNGISSQNSGQLGNIAAAAPRNGIASTGYRNWIGFDLNGLSQTVLGATLVVESDSQNSSGQVFQWWDISTPRSQLGSLNNPSIYNDLGSGTLFGEGIHTAGKLNYFTLNADAVASLNDNRSFWAIGGNNTRPGGSRYDFAFGYRNGIVNDKMQLVLTLQDHPLTDSPIPETGSTIAMVGAGLLGLISLRKRLAADFFPSRAV